MDQELHVDSKTKQESEKGDNVTPAALVHMFCMYLLSVTYIYVQSVTHMYVLSVTHMYAHMNITYQDVCT